ncbi:MAG: M81 family metallopeptidase [Rhodospirillales bacterium]|nr:M81 family metallopeptidase [Rhodospirillales bacterium]MDE0379189.1 M81 family metallopeptidase [Rhodospirillales bacterium]
MRVFIACLGTETNTFSSLPTGEQTYRDTAVFDGDATRHEPSPFSLPLHVWRKRAEAQGHDVAEGFCAFAQPAGRTVRSVYEGYRDRILADARAALPLDLVLVNMHGAMVAEGYDDCEGDLLARLREIVGPETVLGGELDLHCHITRLMLEAATALVTYKEYPHVDIGERADELFRLCHDAALGRTAPVMAAHDCRMISMWRTTTEQMKAFVADMKAQEGRDGILAVSFGHGFPWGDVAEVGAKTLVVADGDKGKAAALAADLGARLWAMREKTRPTAVAIDEALDRALAAGAGPVVLADVSDNAGGGAPSDSTFILERLITRGIGDVASGLYWDPVAVRFCMEAGEGASLNLRIGGKCGPDSGDPVDLAVTVRRIVTGAAQTFGAARNRMGDAAWVRAEGGLDLVLNTVRTQVFHPDAFTAVGLDPAAKKIVVVKSTQHFHAGFAPIAAEILYVAAPGAIAPDFAAIPYTKLTKPYWPRVEDPWAS